MTNNYLIRNKNFLPKITNTHLPLDQIDIVYTYLDNNDVKWQEKINKYTDKSS